MDFNDELATMLAAALDEFGESVNYLPNEGGSVTVRAVFRDPFSQVQAGSSLVAVDSTSPYLLSTVAEFSKDPEEGELVEVRGERYRIDRKKPNGIGGFRLILTLAE